MIYYNEFDKHAAQWLRNLMDLGTIPRGHVDERDIRDVAPSELRPYRQCHFFAGVGVWPISIFDAGYSLNDRIWSASLPCQSFSAAGRGLGFADERHLWPHFFHHVAFCRPPELIGEQVASKDGLGLFDLVSSDLEAAGYAVGASDLCAAGVGAPHIRQRLYWGAYDLYTAGDVGHAVGPGLEGLRGHGHRAQDWALEERPVAASGAAGLLEHDAGDGRDERGAEPGGRGAVSGRGPGRSADSNGGQPREAGGIQSGWQQRLVEEDGRDGDSGTGPGRPTDGFWRDADWLFCRDGKWRPVGPGYVEMVDGSTGGVAQGGTFEGTVEDAGERMQALLETFGEEKVSEWAGGSWSLQEEEVLRSYLHGRLDGGPDEGCRHSEQPQAVGQGGRSGMRDLREIGLAAGGSPHGRRPDEQRPVELADVVRLLPCSLSFAQLRGRWRDAEALLLLQRAIREEGGLLHSSEPVEEIWASLGKEAQDRIRLGFDAGAWRRVASFPLVEGGAFELGSGTIYEGKSRQKILEGLGNAIVRPLATEFVKAWREARVDVERVQPVIDGISVGVETENVSLTKDLW